MRVVFGDQECVDCGQRGDERLLSDLCHEKKVKAKIKKNEKIEKLYSVKYMSCVLGTGDKTKTAEFSEKIETAFDPLPLLSENHIANHIASPV